MTGFIVLSWGCYGCANESQEVANNYITAGYVAQNDDMYYGPFDDWKLYQMDGNSKSKKILSDTGLSPFPYVQFANNKLFYKVSEAMIPEGQSNEPSWIYSYDLKKGKEERLTSSDFTVNNFSIYGNQIFFTTWWDSVYGDTDGGQVYQMKTDGSDLTLVGNFIDDKYIQIVDGKIYLAGSPDPTLMTMDLDGSNIQNQNLDFIDLLVYGDSIYFTVDNQDPNGKEFDMGMLRGSSDSTQSVEQPIKSGDNQYLQNYGIYKTSLSDPSEEPIGLIKGNIVSFSILRNKIYFAGFVNENDEQQKIYETDLDGNNMKFLANGIMPNAVGEYLFYNSSDPPYGITWLPIK